MKVKIMIYMFIEDSLDGKFYIGINCKLSRNKEDALIFHSLEEAEKYSFDQETIHRLQLDSIRFENIETGEEIERTTFDS